MNTATVAKVWNNRPKNKAHFCPNYSLIYLDKLRVGCPESADFDGVALYFSSPVPVRSWNRLHLATNAANSLESALFHPPRQFQFFYWFPICWSRRARTISGGMADRREIDGRWVIRAELLPIKSYWLMQQQPPRKTVRDREQKGNRWLPWAARKITRAVC